MADNLKRQLEVEDGEEKFTLKDRSPGGHTGRVAQ